MVYWFFERKKKLFFFFKKIMIFANPAIIFTHQDHFWKKVRFRDTLLYICENIFIKAASNIYLCIDLHILYIHDMYVNILLPCIYIYTWYICKYITYIYLPAAPWCVLFKMKYISIILYAMRKDFFLSRTDPFHCKMNFFLFLHQHDSPFNYILR